MRILKYIYVLWMCGLILPLYAQSPPSASAFNYGQLLDSPVNLSTGTVLNSIAIYTVSDGPLSHSISLNYHGGGSRVFDVSSEVGLGWSLGAGGFISRSIQGLEDDLSGKGYYYTGQNLVQGHSQAVLDRERDGEPDVYSFNAGSISGRFTLDGNGEFVTIPKSNVLIEPIINSSNRFIGFQITSEDGTKYYFGEMVEPANGLYAYIEQTLSSSSITQIAEVTGWYLRKIESYDDKHSINFDYVSSNYTTAYNEGCFYEQSINGNGLLEDYSNCPVYEYFTLSRSSDVLSQITTTTQTIDFNHIDREDLEEHHAFGLLTKPKALESISIIESDEYCIQYNLGHSYFEDNQFDFTYFSNNILLSTIYGSLNLDKRLKLDQIQKVSCVQGAILSEPPTTFEYYGPTNSNGSSYFPTYISRAIDHWGFYNGESSNESSNMIPIASKVDWNGHTFTYGNAARNVNTNKSRIGALKKIIFPTGGSKEFTLESNSINNTINAQEITDLNIRTCNSNCCSSTAPHQGGITSDEIIISSIQADNAYFEIEFNHPCCSFDSISVSIIIEDLTDPNNVFSVYEDYHLFSTQCATFTSDVVSLSELGDIMEGHEYRFNISSNNGRNRFRIFHFDKYQKVGGLRIKDIRIHDAIDSENDIVTSYKYFENGNAHISSGYLSLEPSYAIGIPFCEVVFFESQPIYPLQDFNGSHIYYENVEVNTNGVGKTIYKFRKELAPVSGPGANENYPAAPTGLKKLAGKIDTVSVLNNQNEIIQKNIVNVKYDPYTLVSGFRMKVRELDWHNCSQYSTWLFSNNYDIENSVFRVSQQRNEVYGVSTVTIYTYSIVEDNYLPIESTVENSDGTIHKSTTDYTFNYDLDPCVKGYFLDNNIRSIPYRTKIYVDDELVDGSETVFGAFDVTNGSKKSCDFSFIGLDIYPEKINRLEKSWDDDGTIVSLGWILQKTIAYHNDNNFYGLPTSDLVPGWTSTYYTYNSDKLLESTYKMGGGLPKIERSFEYYLSTNKLKNITNADGTSHSFVYDELMRLDSAIDDCLNVTMSHDYSFIMQGADINSVSTTTDYSQNPSHPNNAISVLKNIQFMDGLGRKIQDLSVNQGPANNEDIAFSIAYDQYGRNYKSYLAQSAFNNNGNYVNIDLGIPYTYLEYNEDPLSTIKTSYGPGSLAATTSMTEKNSTVDQVRILGTNNHYDSGKLLKTTLVDGNGNKKINFKDKLGRLVLNRVEGGDGAKKSDTYYLYDKKNRLIKVLPPTTNEGMLELIYKYEYYPDDKLKSKKVPSMGKIIYEYNGLGLLGAFQDANLRSDGKVMVYRYDNYGRQLESGFNTSLGNIDGSNNELFQYYIINELLGSNRYGTSGIEINKVVESKVRILNDSNNPQFLTANNYYNTCGQLDYIESNNHLDLNSVNTIEFEYDQTRSVIGNIYDFNVWGVEYDFKDRSSIDHAGREIEYAIKWDDNLSNDFDIQSAYEYNKNEELVLKKLGYSSGNWLQLIDFDYEIWGGLKSINQGSIVGSKPINSCGGLPTANGQDLFAMQLYYDTTLPGAQPLENGSISAQRWQIAGREHQEYLYEYDFLNRLTKANYNDNSSLSDTYSTEYSYDSFGNIQTIKRNGAIHNGSCWETQPIDDLTLSYETETHRLNTVLDNSQGICPENLILTGELMNSGLYAAENRVSSNASITANASTDFTANTAISLFGGFKFSSDGNSNFSGFINPCSTSNNQGSQGAGYVPGIGGNYSYDGNGNTTYLPNKDVVLEYNHLNLVKRASFGNGNSIDFIYNASGSLLARINKSADGSQSRRDFLGMFELMDHQLEIIKHKEGRIHIKDDFEEYQYAIHDHLGNLRVLFSDLNHDGILNVTSDIKTTELMQENHYYPFGLEMQGDWVDAPSKNTPYEYNGLESVNDFGLGLNMTTYRSMDPTLGRWLQVDPDVEMFKRHSPYNAMMNNPISLNDPNGDNPLLVGALVGVAVNGGKNLLQGNNFFQGGLNAAFMGAWSAGATSAIGGAFKGAGFASETGRAVAHGVANGASSAANGGSFKNGFLSGAVSSGFSSIQSKASGLAGYAIGGLSGGISNLISGGSFLQGLGSGLAINALNHQSHGPECDGCPTETLSMVVITAKRVKKIERAFKVVNKIVGAMGIAFSIAGNALVTDSHWLGQNMKYNKMSWTGDGSTGSRDMITFNSGALKTTSNIMSALNYIDIGMQAYEGEISLGVATMEAVSTTVGIKAPFPFNIAWTLGWEAGRAITNMEGYMYRVWGPGGRDGLISTSK